MNEQDTQTRPEDEASSEQKEIANMDEYDYLNLLIESRIIQLS